MGKNWRLERKRDQYYRRAKKEGYRSRAAYKLRQINAKFSMIKKGDVVVDLGCAPGGWSQVALEIVGRKGTVVGVDVAHMSPIEGVRFIRADICDEATVQKIQEALTGRADVIISDMAPNITGHYSYDHANSVHLARAAFAVAAHVLKKGGNFLVKVFDGDMVGDLVSELKANFNTVKIYRPQATRKTSSELYIICKGYVRKNTPQGCPKDK